MNSIKSESAETKTFRLSKRLAIDITVGPAGMVVEWEPHLPEKLSRGELRAYRRARNEMLQRLTVMVGGKVLGVEV